MCSDASCKTNVFEDKNLGKAPTLLRHLRRKSCNAVIAWCSQIKTRYRPYDPRYSGGGGDGICTQYTKPSVTIYYNSTTHISDRARTVGLYYAARLLQRSRNDSRARTAEPSCGSQRIAAENNKRQEEQRAAEKSH